MCDGCVWGATAATCGGTWLLAVTLCMPDDAGAQENVRPPRERHTRLSAIACEREPVACGAGLLHMVCGSSCSARGRSDLPTLCGGTVGFCGAPVRVLLCRGASLRLVRGDVGPMVCVRSCVWVRCVVISLRWPATATIVVTTAIFRCIWTNPSYPPTADRRLC